MSDLNALLDELAKDIEFEGKATLDVAKHAHGSKDVAENMLRSAAHRAGIPITVKSNKTSAIALVDKVTGNGDTPSDEEGPSEEE